MKALILLLLIPNLAFAWKDDPYEVFDMSRRMYSNVEIEIVTSNDISNRCQQESRKRGFGGFPYTVYACSFWNENRQRKCTIYLPTQTDMHQLGHEVRHCFQGSSHP